MNEAMQTYSVTIGGKQYLYPVGTTYRQIAADFQAEFAADIVLVLVNGNKLQELRKTLEKDIELSFVTTETSIGSKAYKRSICMLFVKAVYDVVGKENVEQVRLLFAVSSGYYAKIKGNLTLNQELLNQIKNRMYELVAEDIFIEKRSVHTEEAIDLFREYGMKYKEKLFKYRRVSRVNLYRIRNFEDYYYGYMVPSTGYLKYFELVLYDEGLVLQLPNRKNCTVIRPFAPNEKLFRVQKEAVRWGDLQDIETVGDLNERITTVGIQEMILVQEAQQERRIAEIASAIAAQKEKKFILVAGPSSSGKTTFSHRLSIQLRVNGVIPHPIAVDNYFVNREDTPRDEDGEYNYECIEAIDTKQLNQDLNRLLSGEEVELPRFNFKSGKREYRGDMLKLGSDDVLVIEGIHGLNDKLTAELPKENKYKIYISALTQLNIDEHNRIPTTDGRLLRRMVRDARTRGTSAKQTIAMWPSVRRGEDEYIFPYQEDADVMFNSALIYELSVLKQFVEPILFGIEKECPEYVEAKRLLKFLDYFVGVPTDYIPMNSLLKEFIGNGCFEL